MNKELLKSNLDILSTISNEYNLRLTFGAIALLLEHGGISLINKLTGVSRKTMSKKIDWDIIEKEVYANYITNLLTEKPNSLEF